MQLHAIIQGCFNNDNRCQRLLYDSYRGFACKVVFRYIYRYERAMDVVTDGFVKLFLHFQQFRYAAGEDTEKQLLGWLKKVMINAAIDELRRSNMLPEIGAINEDVWDYSDKTYDADQLLLYKDLVTITRQLPPNYRVVFNLYVTDGYTHSQIADLLQISLGTSRSMLSRARTILQAAIKNLEKEKACRI